MKLSLALSFLLAPLTLTQAATPIDSGVSYWHGNIQGSNAGSAGYTFYANVFDLFQEGYPINAQMGLAGTWYTLPREQGQEANTCACPKWGEEIQCCNQEQSWCTQMAWSIEGGGGYWRSTFPKDKATWQLVSSSACYNDYARTLYWNPSEQACANMNVVQLSNSLLLPPDGISFDSTEGLVGYGWLNTPMGKVTDDDSRNFWTLVFDTEAFKGPVLYVLPEFYAEREPDQQVGYIPDLGNGAIGLQMGESSAEVQMVPTFQTEDGSGSWRPPRTRFPNNGGKTILSMGQKSYLATDVGGVLEISLENGSLDTSEILANGLPVSPSCFDSGGCISDAMFTVNAESGREYRMGYFNTTMEGDDVIWALEINGCTDPEGCWIPQYLTDGMVAMGYDEAPQDLKDAVFEEKVDANPPHGPFDAASIDNRALYGTCFDSPGPASSGDVYCASTLGGTWVAWQWYKFVDQPALQRLGLSEEEKAFMQGRVEVMHALVDGEGGDWIKRGERVEGIGLATFDDSAVVLPPEGLERGYAPVAIYEGREMPGECTKTQ